MSLLEVAKATLLKEVLNCEAVVKYAKPSFPGDLNKLLVVDDETLQFIKELARPSELADMGYISIQHIKVILQPIPIHLIYLIQGSEENIDKIVKTFTSSNCPFVTVHIFATTRLGTRAMQSIQGCSNLVKKLASLKQVPFSFVVETDHIFTLGLNLTIPEIYGPSKDACDTIAARILNMFIVTDERPCIRYMQGSDLSKNVATKLEELMQNYSSKNRDFGMENNVLKQCQIVFVERVFDCPTTLLHDLTVEPMTRDVLPVQDNCLEFQASSKDHLKIYLNDPSSVWQAIRFMHLADALTEASTKIKELSQQYNISFPEGNVSINAIRNVMTNFPKHRVNFLKYQSILLLLEKLMSVYKSNNLECVVHLEQDFATNADDKGDPVSDNPAVYVNSLEEAMSVNDRFRLISLFALKSKQGVDARVFDKLVEIANISFAKKALSNLDTLHFPIIQDNSKIRPPPVPAPPQDDSVSSGYTVSRYIAKIWTLLTQMVDQSLSEQNFPIVGEKRKFTTPQGSSSDVNFGFGKYNKKKTDVVKRTNPTIYVFIIGGACFAEFRLLHLFAQKHPQWTARLGGTEFLTPDKFIDYLKNM